MCIKQQKVNKTQFENKEEMTIFIIRLIKSLMVLYSSK